MRATTDGTLAECEVQFKKGAAACVIMASKGYPEKYESGFEITMSEAVKPEVFVAGAKLDGDKLLTAGGRVLGVSATADTLGEAISRAYENVKEVNFSSAFYRKDIGARAMKAINKN